LTGVANEAESITGKALNALRKYPLCDRCLGRLFARLGYGWSNRERGEALKRLIVMELHRRMLEGDNTARTVFLELAPRLYPYSQGLYEKLTGKGLGPEACIICGGTLDDFIRKAAENGAALLKAHDISRFVVGVRLSGGIDRLEDEIKAAVRAEHGESIKSEIRREVGKLIQSIDTGLTVDFDDPEATLLVEYPTGMLWLQVNSIFYKGRYWKKGRLISQAYWPTPTGPKYYSIEEALWGLLGLHKAERLVLHASGREDVDARMLGTGRPMIIELKSPRVRRVPVEAVVRAANKNKALVEVAIEGSASRREVRLYKEGVARTTKTYKALIVSGSPLSDTTIRRIEDFFSDRTIMQRTPRRVLHRRPDILRRRKVYTIKCKRISNYTMECVIVAEGGLYIKELVSGDEGRTTPSMSEITGSRMECVELDVIGVKHEAEITA